ncbi:GH25 family lysozyme [Salininema proteolyticum]|uniref:GH25 family lysozyme n=1 Tax=Salininema proteolyticum TaxID=1607685 RepID=A0ABV8TVQ0_9ACTN
MRRSLTISTTLALAFAASAAPGGAQEGEPEGFAATSLHENADWRAAAAEADFAYVRALTGLDQTDASLFEHVRKSGAAGVPRGLYHEARPDVSTGSRQAHAHIDLLEEAVEIEGDMLPANVDLAPNPTGPDCYGKMPGEMRTWIEGYVTTWENQMGESLVVHTDTRWWNECTGDWPAMGDRVLLSHHEPASAAPGLPAGWDEASFEWYWDPVEVPGLPETTYRGVFHGSAAELEELYY